MANVGQAGVIYGEDGRYRVVVCFVPMSEDVPELTEAEYRTRVCRMAAADELLEACKETASLIAGRMTDFRRLGESEAWQVALDSLGTAIAKAEGA